MSYPTVIIARIIFVIFNPFDIDSPPLAIENVAPTKSKIMLNIDHPFVLFLFQFQYTAGLYFKKLIESLQYPRQLTGLNNSYSGISPKNYIIKKVQQ